MGTVGGIARIGRRGGAAVDLPLPQENTLLCMTGNVLRNTNQLRLAEISDLRARTDSAQT